MSRIKQVIDVLEAERSDVKQRLEWLERQIGEFRKQHNGSAEPVAAPARSRRRSTAKRASSRRATARSLQTDTATRIVDYLTDHPGSTAGDLSKALDLKRNSVSTRLTQMAKAGEIKKAKRGYTTK